MVQVLHVRTCSACHRLYRGLTNIDFFYSHITHTCTNLSLPLSVYITIQYTILNLFVFPRPVTWASYVLLAYRRTDLTHHKKYLRHSPKKCSRGFSRPDPFSLIATTITRYGTPSSVSEDQKCKLRIPKPQWHTLKIISGTCI